ncbi:unnamed protein product [Clonostachys byssicola]|uniref:Uncharacterized protein n=1 Tax=Clonostachys byssicola TaxID=160290 RepID=A0A9N9UBZ4_9HYPO|nr:unnamed protein product [Clonostachys byssicola]
MASNAKKCIISPGVSLGDPSMKRKQSPTTALQGREKVMRKGQESRGPSLDIQTWKDDVVLPRFPDSEQASLRWKYRMNCAIDIPTIENEWWGGLKDEISGLVMETLPMVISWEYVNDQGKKSLSTWFPRAKDYIDLCKKRKREDGSSCIYSAWIWHILMDCIFSPSTKKWRDEEWNSFGRFHSKFKEHVDSVDNEFTLSFYSWRSESVRMLYMFNGTHIDPELVKQTLRDHLGPSFVVRGADDSIIEEALSNIVDQAILMDRQMLASKWDFRVEMCDPSSGRNSDFLFTTDEALMRFDGHFQETPAPRDGARVDFVSAPSFRVLGKPVVGEATDPYTEFMIKRLVKYYHVPSLHIPILVVTDQLSENARERLEAIEAEKKRARKGKGGCEDTVAENV